MRTWSRRERRSGSVEGPRYDWARVCSSSSRRLICGQVGRVSPPLSTGKDAATGRGTRPLKEAGAVALDEQPRALARVELLRLLEQRLLERRLVRALLRAGRTLTHDGPRARGRPTATHDGGPAARARRGLHGERDGTFVRQAREDVDGASDRRARDDLAFTLDADDGQERRDEVVCDGAGVCCRALRGRHGCGGAGRGGGGRFRLGRVEDHVVEEERQAEVEDARHCSRARALPVLVLRRVVKGVSRSLEEERASWYARGT